LSASSVAKLSRRKDEEKTPQRAGQQLTPDQRIQRLEDAVGNLVAFFQDIQAQMSGQPQQGNPQQGNPLAALLSNPQVIGLAAQALKGPDPMEQLTMAFLTSSITNQNAMAQATINLANNIAQMLVKEKIQVKTSE